LDRHQIKTSYLICTLPQSGGSLLAHALRGVGAGRPDDYFRTALRSRFEKEWSLDPETGDENFLAGARAAGTAVNGVFGATAHWFEFEELIAMLRGAAPSEDSPGPETERVQRQTDHSLLSEYLPNLCYVHVTRRDKVGQAVASYRAMSASRSCELGADRSGRTDTRFDAQAIDRLYQRLLTEDWKWVAYFGYAGVRSLVVTYEALTSDYVGTIRAVAEKLGIQGANRLSVPPAPHEDHSPETQCWRGSYTEWRRKRVRHANRNSPSVSVVVVTHNEGGNLERTIGAFRATVPDSVELLVVDDHSTDGSTAFLTDQDRVRAVRPPQRAGVAGSRNYGASNTSGEVVVFADAHVNPLPGWLAPLCSVFADPEIAAATPTISSAGRPNAKGFGFTWSEPSLAMRWIGNPPWDRFVPFICGCFMAFRREDFESVGGFDTGMRTWGSEDAEICLHLWRRGRGSVVVPTSRVRHLFRPVFPYPVRWTWTIQNALRLAVVHLGEQAQRRIVQHFAHREQFAAAFEDLLVSDVWLRRDAVRSASTHDDRWFLDRFRIRCFE
jgi:LPS sulfotransferase NodH/glycosyltransferase involved in cell wall biosynthesis